MAIHTDDLLEKLDRVLAQPYLPPAEMCAWCRVPLSENGASLDFCTPRCQKSWQLSRTDGAMRDGGRGWAGWGGLYDDDDDACFPHCGCGPLREQWALWEQMGLRRPYRNHVQEVHHLARARENERQRAVDLAFDMWVGARVEVASNPPMSMRARTADLIARWTGVDPDS